MNGVFDVYVDVHAFKHGVTCDEIQQAWNEIVAIRHRNSPHEGEIVAIGLSRKGEAIELVAATKSYGVLIYHAIKPPTEKVLRELRHVRRNR